MPTTQSVEALDKLEDCHLRLGVGLEAVVLEQFALTYRRCRAELHGVQGVERQGRWLAVAAMHCLALGETVEAAGLLRRACAIHASPELLALLYHLMNCPAGVSSPQLGEGGDPMTDTPSATGGA